MVVFHHCFGVSQGVALKAGLSLNLCTDRARTRREGPGTAYATRLFEQDDLCPHVRRPGRRGDARGAAADDDDVELAQVALPLVWPGGLAPLVDVAAGLLDAVCHGVLDCEARERGAAHHVYADALGVEDALGQAIEGGVEDLGALLADHPSVVGVRVLILGRDEDGFLAAVLNELDVRDGVFRHGDLHDDVAAEALGLAGVRAGREGRFLCGPAVCERRVGAERRNCRRGACGRDKPSTGHAIVLNSGCALNVFFHG